MGASVRPEPLPAGQAAAAGFPGGFGAVVRSRKSTAGPRRAVRAPPAGSWRPRRSAPAHPRLTFRARSSTNHVAFPTTPTACSGHGAPPRWGPPAALISGGTAVLSSRGGRGLTGDPPPGCPVGGRRAGPGGTRARPARRAGWRVAGAGQGRGVTGDAPWTRPLALAVVRVPADRRPPPPLCPADPRKGAQNGSFCPPPVISERARKKGLIDPARLDFDGPSLSLGPGTVYWRNLYPKAPARLSVRFTNQLPPAQEPPSHVPWWARELRRASLRIASRIGASAGV